MPVVSTDVGDVATILETSQAGVVIKDAKPRNFLTALEDIINNQNRYIEVAKNGRVYALKNHTDGQMCKNIVAVYLEVMV